MSATTGSIAFVQATWHQEIVDQARDGFAREMVDLGFEESRLEYFRVPGAFEIPLRAKRLARTGNYAAIIAAALVVDGGIYRHEFVATAVINGLMQVQLETDVPVFSVVLTPHHFHEHREHLAYFHTHLREKGAEAARACAAILSDQV